MKRFVLGLVTCASVVAYDVPASAYRTGADAPGTSDTARVRWASSSVAMRINTNGVPGVPFSTVESIILASMSTWTNVDCSDVAFSYRGGTNAAAVEDGTNTIEWHRFEWEQLGFPADSAGVTDLLYERSAQNEWVIVEADLHLNAYDFTWATSTGDPTSTVRAMGPVVVHELGHVLGLLHPCEPGAQDGAPDCAGNASFLATTMYPLYTGLEQATLDPDDIAGACFLYPTAPCEPACEGAATCREGVCVPTCGGTVCGQGETCVADVCMTACAGIACLAEGPCESEKDCSDGYACQSQLCLPRGGELADPCDVHDACASGVCFEGGCSLSCFGTCGTGYSCEPASEGAVCAPQQGTFGAACAASAECATGICLVGDQHTQMCTRACGGSRLPCPEGYECAVVDGASVCAPPTDGGCAVHRSGRPAPYPLITLLVFACLARRRNRRLS